MYITNHVDYARSSNAINKIFHAFPLVIDEIYQTPFATDASCCDKCLINNMIYNYYFLPKL